MTSRSSGTNVTFVPYAPEVIATSTSLNAPTWSSYASGYYQTDPAYNVIWENPVPLNDLSKYLSSIPPKDAKRIIGILEDNAKSLEDHLDSGYLKSSGGTVAGATTFGSTVNLYSGVNLGQQSLYSMLPPVGSIMPYAGNKSPLGWLVCDGTAYDTTIYAPLYNVLGSTYDTSTGLSAPAAGYFRVPNLKGRMPLGFDAGITDFNTRGKSGGSTTVTLTTAQMPSHSHTTTVTDPGHVHLQNEASTGGLLANPSDSLTDYTYYHTGAGRFNTNSATTGITVGLTDTGGGGSHDNMSPYLVLNYIIKT
jgi:microcystin-dependent protein